jgi:hypothetical protein
MAAHRLPALARKWSARSSTHQVVTQWRAMLPQLEQCSGDIGLVLVGATKRLRFPLEKEPQEGEVVTE